MIRSPTVDPERHGKIAREAAVCGSAAGRRSCSGNATELGWCRFVGRHAAGASVVSRSSLTRSGRSARPGPHPACRRTPSDHVRRRTHASASEKVTVALPGHDRVRPERARGGPRRGLRAPAARRLRARVGAHLSGGGFDIPTAAVVADDIRGRQLRVGGVQELVAVRAGRVADARPPRGFARHADLEAVSERGVTVSAPVPTPKDACRDRHQRPATDSLVIGGWRERMGTAAAKGSVRGAGGDGGRRERPGAEPGVAAGPGSGGGECEGGGVVVRGGARRGVRGATPRRPGGGGGVKGEPRFDGLRRRRVAPDQDASGPMAEKMTGERTD